MNNIIVIIYYIPMTGAPQIQCNKNRASIGVEWDTIMDVLNLNSMIIVYEKRI